MVGDEEDLLDEYINNHKTSEDSYNSNERNINSGRNNGRYIENFQNYKRFESLSDKYEQINPNIRSNVEIVAINNETGTKIMDSSSPELQIRYQQSKNVNNFSVEDVPLSSERKNVNRHLKNISNSTVIEKKSLHKDSEDTAYFQDSYKHASNTPMRENNNLELNVFLK